MPSFDTATLRAWQQDRLVEAITPAGRKVLRALARQVVSDLTKNDHTLVEFLLQHVDEAGIREAAAGAALEQVKANQAQRTLEASRKLARALIREWNR